jgi:1-deoxy-D-xylulose-5-phosphate reductoisomerase
MELARRRGVSLLPVDSEHSAIFQALRAGHPREVHRVILTSSGGPFRGKSARELAEVTPEEALRHPTWRMGPKITIDSATLMNKGLEVIEARWLFDVPFERIRVVMHPTSTVHSLVQFRDGALKAQLGAPDMKAPIQFALSYPERWSATAPELDIITASPLVFAELPPGRYPCLDLALEAGRRGGTYPAALCGADEVAVGLFLERRIPFTAIARLVGAVLERHAPGDENDLEAIVAADAWARDECQRLAGTLG